MNEAVAGRREYVALAPGDPAPWFRSRTTGNPRFALDNIAGRYVVLCFFGSAGDRSSRAALESMAEHRRLFDDKTFSFFGVSNDPRDESESRVRDEMPGVRFLLDFDGAVARLYGALPKEAKDGGGSEPVRRYWIVLDPTLRVLATFPFATDAGGHSHVFQFIETLPSPDRFAGIELQAPILYLPNVFEPEFCRALIDLYEANGGTESGFMRDIDGKTVKVQDHRYKRRRDFVIQSEDIINQTKHRIQRRIVPEIAKVHQFHVTRMERYIVSCYSAEDQGHFHAHRDNTTAGTAHRRFAVSINLNSEFEGGEVSFPEYSPRGFKPPVGGACVFSCSLLHAVSPVTGGRRYAFLPFLYDNAAAKIRAANNVHLGEGVAAYKEDPS